MSEVYRIPVSGECTHATLVRLFFLMMLLELARLLKKTVVNFRAKYMFGYLTFSHIRRYWEMQYLEGLHGIMEALTVTQRAWQAWSLPVILNQW